MTWRVFAPLVVVALAALGVTLAEGTPARLPGVALESAVLLHAERAVALFALVVAAATILERGARGRLPTELGTTGVGYEAAVAEESRTAVESLQAQVDELEEALVALAERLDARDEDVP